MIEIKDKDGKPIKEGDTLNIYFTSSNGEFIHDCIYEATTGPLGDIQFKFIDLMWVDNGLNQYPASTTLCIKDNTLGFEYDKDQIKLIIPDSWGENHMHRHRWKELDKSYYFKVIENQDSQNG